MIKRLISLIFLAWVLGFAWFALLLPQPAPAEKTDAIVVLMTLASGAVVIMTARAALGTHYATIEMLHMIGATDQQITRLFQRRIAIDTAYGIALGTVVAALILLLIGWQWSGVTSGLAATASLGPAGWTLLLALPLLAIALAALTARLTLLAALQKIL